MDASAPDPAAAPDPTAEKVARNEAVLREANERIAGTAKELGMTDEGLLPFICECADTSCTQILQLTTDEYQQVRASPTTFINARGHEVNALGWGRVVDEFDRYSIVAKLGDAAEVVQELDARSEEPT